VKLTLYLSLNLLLSRYAVPHGLSMSCHCVDNGIITCTDLDGPNDWVMDASVFLPAIHNRVTAAKNVLKLAPIGLKAFKHPFYSFDEASFIAGTLQVHVLDTSDCKHIANWAKVLARDSTSDSEIEVGLGESIHRDSWICLRDSCKDPWVQSWYELANDPPHDRCGSLPIGNTGVLFWH